MTGTTSDHGGLYYIELIKSNLQFIHGKECFFEVLSQVKAPDQWKVSVLKTEGGFRTVLFSDSGVGLLNVLEKLHRKSAEKLDKFMADNTADAYAYVKRKEGEAAKAAKVSSSKDQAKETKEVKETKEKTPPKTPVPEAAVEPRDPRISSNSDSDSSDDFGPDSASVFVKSRRGQGMWRDRSIFDEPISIRCDPSLRSRSLLCPNYGPASSFYRISPSGRPEALDEIAIRGLLKADRELRRKERREEQAAKEAAKTASAPAVAPAQAAAPAPVPAPDTTKTQAQPQVAFATESQMTNDLERLALRSRAQKHRAEPLPAPKNVLVHIRWPEFGDAVVADECQLSVKEVQSHVRGMLKSHGSDLFNLTRPVNPLMFMSNQLANFSVAVKAINFDDQRFMLGPKVGDDLTKVSKDVESCKAIKIEVEVKYIL
ncbi:uncharacterized protein Triagg1_5318 [Trichoderma aggressivum f. europaeum]|uniref:Uncharacterized protein n=1 Tax=Trichoderma aggressivum f. europaeum TaxID=173218 RepID=A0AAE1LZL0_9HYPO|nr:hypothetical protein Triagg1_5318 [Trichoderma aggressivum f. europaeum]